MVGPLVLGRTHAVSSSGQSNPSVRTMQLTSAWTFPSLKSVICSSVILCCPPWTQCALIPPAMSPL